MRLVYIISAYKLPDMLIRLVNRLQAEDVNFFIHIDKKTSPEISGRMETGLDHFDNVFFLDRHNCYWGDFGHVRATLKGIREIVERDIAFDYTILLTGQDYPLKTNRVIKDYFRQNAGRSFMGYGALPDKNWDVMWRIDRWYHSFWGITIGFPPNLRRGVLRRYGIIKKINDFLFPMKRKFLHDMKPYAGWGYWNLTGEAIRYIYDYVKYHPDFVQFFKNSFIPDELFFQTILLNSPLRGKIVSNSLRHIDWSCGGRHPAILTLTDFEALRASPHLFARKFDTAVDSCILDLIDQHLLREVTGSLVGL